MLLMRVMIMEYNQLLFRKRYRLQWGLTAALAALRQVSSAPSRSHPSFTSHAPRTHSHPALRQVVLTPPPGPGEPFSNDFHHSFYLATHMVYVQSAYNVIKASEL